MMSCYLLHIIQWVALADLFADAILVLKLSNALILWRVEDHGWTASEDIDDCPNLDGADPPRIDPAWRS